MLVSFVYMLLRMLPHGASQLLLFLVATFLLQSTASAGRANWLFPASEAPLEFESQDTIDASWTSKFVAPVLTLFCQDKPNDGFYPSKSNFRAHSS